MGLIDDLIPNVDAILGIRDDLGVALKPVYLVTRTWTGSEVGDGTSTDVRTRMLPSPRVVEFKNDFKTREGGTVKAGDIMLKMVSKQTYTLVSELDCSSDSPSVEKFYELGTEKYRPIGFTEKHITWNVVLRRVSP